MIISAAIVSKGGETYCSENLPYDFRKDLAKHAKNFLYALSIENDDIELPYIETSNLRYVYKQTNDLYWLLVTKPDSDMFVDIDLLGKYVCIIMEYGAAETNSETLTDEQRRLFYRHIWRPWDEGTECPCCGRHCNCNTFDLWTREFESRVQFLNSVRDGRVDERDATYFNGLIDESWSIHEQLSSKNSFIKDNDNFISDSDSFCSSEGRSISEETVIDGCRLKCRLEDIRVELNRLQDPYLRLFARRDLLIGTPFDQNLAKISTAPSMEELSICNE